MKTMMLRGYEIVFDQLTSFGNCIVLEYDMDRAVHGSMCTSCLGFQCVLISKPPRTWINGQIENKDNATLPTFVNTVTFALF